MSEVILAKIKLCIKKIESYGPCQNIVTIALTITNKVHSTIYFVFKHHLVFVLVFYRSDAHSGLSFSCFFFLHYENTPMQYTAIFHGCKK